MMLTDKSNLDLSSSNHIMSIPRSDKNHKLDTRSSALNQQRSQQSTLSRHSREENSREVMNDPHEQGIEPLDYRQDWSQEILHTFGTLHSSFHLEKALIR